MSHPLRIIDANANRAREALRVMEDCARFVLDDEGLCVRIKAVRHGLAEALSGLCDGAMIAWRDTQGDVGTSVVGAGEYRREGVRDVVVAAGKRLSEALRSIEEFAKVIEVGRLGEPTYQRSQRIEALRYLGYDIERDLVLAMGCSRRAAWKLCVIVSEALCVHHPWLEVARRAVLGGAECLQLREKEMESRELLSRARALVEMVRGLGGTGLRPVLEVDTDHGGDRGHPHHRSETGATGAGAAGDRARCAVIINDRPDIALLSGADGVHLGQTDMSVLDARRIVGMDLLVGVSTERIEQARAALRDGADYLGVGPMFETTTKQKPRVAGPGYLRDVLAHEPALPTCLAIGGVNAARMGELRENTPGFGERWGVAVSSAVCGAREPEGVCRGIIRGGTEV